LIDWAVRAQARRASEKIVVVVVRIRIWRKKKKKN
jgi:hypothetical protein